MLASHQPMAAVINRRKGGRKMLIILVFVQDSQDHCCHPPTHPNRTPQKNPRALSSSSLQLQQKVHKGTKTNQLELVAEGILQPRCQHREGLLLLLSGGENWSQTLGNLN